MIYEINTRVWIKRFAEGKNNVTLNNVPTEYWRKLKDLGFTYIWLMGVWETCDSVIEKYCFQPDLTFSYKHALHDFSNKDVIGSPYAINDYKLNPLLGNESTLPKLKEKLNKLGLKLILDFIPNHFSAHSELTKTNPEIFLQVDRSFYERDQQTYFQSIYENDRYFAHGRDPFFPAWEDTIQVNYSSSSAREFMKQSLLSVTENCDAVRCDMAMLSLNNIFKNTWSGVIPDHSSQKFQKEFWEEVIPSVKKANINFKFIAEVYWDLEWKMQKLGFDYTYDKRLTDRLEHETASGIIDHLKANLVYQQKSIRFLENHDEVRARTKFGKEKSMMAAIIAYTLPGMKFIYDGQLEGNKINLPVQLGREPDQIFSKTIEVFYKKLLAIISENIFKTGSWTLLKAKSVGDDEQSFKNILIWQWKLEDDYRLVVVNYSEKTSKCKLFLSTIKEGSIKFLDLFNNTTYIRDADEINNDGLYIELSPFHSHIFKY